MAETGNSKPGWVASLLSFLREAPLWLLFGVALAAFLLLFLPAPKVVDIAGFRHYWGGPIWAVAVLFAVLACLRTVDRIVTLMRQRNAHRPLQFMPIPQRGFWSNPKQPDGTTATQIQVRAHVLNRAEGMVRIVETRLLHPATKPEMVNAFTLVDTRQRYAETDVPAHIPGIAIINLFIRRKLGKPGRHLRLSIALVDHVGNVYRLRNLSVPPDQRREAEPTLLERLRTLFRRRTEEAVGELPALPGQWNHGGRFERVELILQEEQRQYGVNGRMCGGLGSLNVTLQSEPNFGWTHVGDVPQLLWDKGTTSRISSKNADLLVAFYDSLDEQSKIDLIAYLTSHLDRRSPYANVTYFIFIVLYRLGHGVSALAAARANLSGDTAFGYSNLLGTLSALVSHEHFEISDGEYARYLIELEGDAEPDFRLREKIRVARLEQGS